MAGGIPVGRSWVVMMQSGVLAIDWGDGLYQEAISGDFFNANDSQVSHGAQSGDLDWLQKIGRVLNYSDQMVYFVDLPEKPSRTLE